MFHRVIDGFMIQGGDPESRTAKKGQQLGNGGVGYTIPAEFKPELFHKKGALAAARMNDHVNPEKESSGCQFYIVHGKTFTKEEVQTMIDKKNKYRLDEFYKTYFNEPEQEEYLKRLNELKKKKDQEGLRLLYEEVKPIVEMEFEKRGDKITLTDEQFETYATVGGTPHLDMDYTVFGEVVEGLDVVDKIAAVEKDKNNRPDEDIRMTIKIVKK